MKILLMMLIAVFTISLYATSVEDDTATNSLRISTINSQEAPLEIQVLPYDHIAILNVGIRKEDYSYMLESKQSALIEKTDVRLYKTKNSSGGVNRIKSGSH